jgi:hypothetical protein
MKKIIYALLIPVSLIQGRDDRLSTNEPKPIEETPRQKRLRTLLTEDLKKCEEACSLMGKSPKYQVLDLLQSARIGGHEQGDTSFNYMSHCICGDK